MDDYHVTADDIFWKTNRATVSRDQYTVINRTSSSVTFLNIPLINVLLSCNIRMFGQINRSVYGIRIISGCKFCFTFFISDFVMTVELHL